MCTQIKRIALFLDFNLDEKPKKMEYTAQILILVYIMITFIYSALEKVFNWEPSKQYYRSHFKGTFMEKFIPPSLIIVIFLELITTVLTIVGIYSLLVFDDKKYGFYGLLLAAVTLLGLMTGQRIAKDYSGAMLITVYFMLTVFGVFIMQ